VVTSTLKLDGWLTADVKGNGWIGARAGAEAGVAGAASMAIGFQLCRQDFVSDTSGSSYHRKTD